MKRTISKKMIESLLKKKNTEYGTHFELFGSWATKDFSDNDIDIRSSVEGEDENWSVVNDIGSYISKETGMLTEIHFVFDVHYGKDVGRQIMRYYSDGRRGSARLLQC